MKKLTEQYKAISYHEQRISRDKTILNKFNQNKNCYWAKRVTSNNSMKLIFKNNTFLYFLVIPALKYTNNSF